MLSRCNLLCGQRLIHGQRRQLERLIILIFIVANGVIQHHKAGEFNGVSAGAEKILSGSDVHGNGVQLGIFHLAGHKAFPNQLIELKLVIGELTLDRIRRKRRVGRTNGLMRVLRTGLGLIHVRRLGAVLRAEFIPDQCTCGCLRLLGDAQRVGTHIGNQTVRGALAEADALVQLLRDHHCALRLEAEPAVGLLLKGGSCERRQRFPTLDGFFDTADRKRSLLQLRKKLFGLLAIGNRKLFFRRTVEFSDKRLAGFLEKPGGNRPVFFRNKSLYLLLTLDNHSRGNRLHAAGGKSAFNLFP